MLWFLTTLALFVPLPQEESPLRALSMKLLEVNELMDEYEEVVQEFQKENKKYQPARRLAAVSRILDDPFELEAVTLSLEEGLALRTADRALEELPELLSFTSDVIDCSTDPYESMPSFEEIDFPEDHLLFIEEVLDQAKKLRASALENLDEEEVEIAYEALPAILDKFIKGVYLESEADDDELKGYAKGLKLLDGVEYSEMVEAAMVLTTLVHPEYLKKLRVDLNVLEPAVPPEAEAAGFSGDLFYYKDTPHGPVVIGGRKKTTYAGKAAFILDLGGDDLYQGAASTIDKDRGLSLVIDLAGDDRYEGEAGACRLGVSLLFDLRGNDTYEGTRCTQGFAAGGVALLWDESGKDSYSGEEYAQGGAFFGVGLLVDREGKDTFDAFLYSQGFGLTGGLGALVDVEGDDVFTATGHYPCTYGQKGVFHAASQGHGTGLRRVENHLAPMYGGGIGLLLDLEGDDRYDAGNFSQGCGYFFGCGMLVDAKGDDYLRGSRYTQGTGAHQAAGIVVNGTGNDEYIATVAANQAGTWDITAGMFLDYKGNDTYRAEGLAQAGTAQTAFALLFDGQGKDTYQARSKDCQGGTGSYEYHDKPSFSFFIDLGGGRDKYNRPGRKDNQVFLEKWYGVFADLRQKSIESVLKGSDKKLKGKWGKREK